MRKLKTLIVEDDFTSRLFLHTLLSQYGDCRIAVNGNEALDQFRAARTGKKPFDLICMDIVMPEKDGQTALREIRRIEEEQGVPAQDAVKILMVTAVNDTSSAITAYQGLCNGYLTKPVDGSNLMARLRSLNLIEARP